MRPAICTTPISVPSGVCDDHAAPLVLLARLVEGGVEEGARHVDRAHDAAGHRRALDVHVEDGEEDRNAHALRRRRGRARPAGARVSMAADAPVGRGDDQPLAQRRHAVGIAEEIGDPGGDQHRADPGQRRPQQEEAAAPRPRDGDELVAVAVDGREAVGDGVEQAMASDTGPPDVSGACCRCSAAGVVRRVRMQGGHGSAAGSRAELALRPS